MTLYCDIFTGDPMFSDDYSIKEIDDVAYEVDCPFTIITNEADNDEEEAQNDVYVNKVIDSFRLYPTTFDKNSYFSHLKRYLNNLNTKLNETDPERALILEKNAKAFAITILHNFRDYDFYTGESQDPDGMIALLNYRKDGVTPYLTFFKDGLTEKEL